MYIAADLAPVGPATSATAQVVPPSGLMTVKSEFEAKVHVSTIGNPGSGLTVM